MPGDTHTCSDCGDRQRNPNPLDYCGREQLGCNNPCGVGPKNSAKCESLPSQIENFTLQFFGTVVKTEINGQVTWSLPCNLETGLPGNPRGVDEGLACYFLRLFQDGLGGLKGDKGDTGTPGKDGSNAFSVVVKGFTQPTTQSPLVQFVVVANPAIQAGMNVFIQGSGYYLVTDVQAGGVVFATFQVPVSNPVSYVAVGALVIPTGANAIGLPGTPGVKGDKGDQGDQGDKGDAGPLVTQQNGFVYATESNAPFSLPDAFATVSFGGLSMEFVAPESGIYLVTSSVSILTTTQTAQVADSPELVKVRMKLFNTTTSTNVIGTETYTGFVFTNTAASQAASLTVSAIVSVGLGETISLRARSDSLHSGVTGGQAWATFTTGEVSWVRIA